VAVEADFLVVPVISSQPFIVKYISCFKAVMDPSQNAWASAKNQTTAPVQHVLFFQSNSAPTSSTEPNPYEVIISRLTSEIEELKVPKATKTTKRAKSAAPESTPKGKKPEPKASKGKSSVQMLSGSALKKKAPPEQSTVTPNRS
jgi:hypothetical protein